jgi:hypothetical protein
MRPDLQAVDSDSSQLCPLPAAHASSTVGRVAPRPSRAARQHHCCGPVRGSQRGAGRAAGRI